MADSAADMSEPPIAGEIWRPIDDAGRAVVVLGRGADSIEYAWLDSDCDERGATPAGEWNSRFAIVLEHADHAQATPVRRRILIDDQAGRFRGKSVLELGAHTGGLTTAILAHARSVTVVENNPRCTAQLRERFGAALRIVEDDMHHALWRLAPGSFEVVVCAGVLYHSAHPFALLEAMAYLEPRSILIDTLNRGVAEARVVVPHMINSCNYRYNPRPDCGFSVVLGDGLIERAMRNLGYVHGGAIDKASAQIAEAADSEYLREWRHSFAAWFDRADAG